MAGATDVRPCSVPYVQSHQRLEYLPLGLLAYNLVGQGLWSGNVYVTVAYGALPVA